MKLTSFHLALFIAISSPVLAAVPAGKSQQLTKPDQVPEGLAKSDWTSIRAAYEAGRHQISAVAGGHQAHNPGQQWTTTFDGRGFITQPNAGGWQWGFELKSYGFEGNERTLAEKPAAQAVGPRMTYAWDAAVQEWFVNDQRGLEHGFTVARRPEKDGKDSSESESLSSFESFLSFTLAVRGTLRPVLTADAQGVQFQDDHGATVLTYAGLKVWDADGKTLPSHFAPSDSQPTVRLLVDERGARYPITVDPIAQQAYVKASNSGDGDQFGYAVAISGDTVVIGAPYEDGSGSGVNPASDELVTNAGAAYVFVRSGATWSQQAYLKASNTGAFDEFGYSVAVSGDTVVIGAPYEEGSGSGVDPVSDDLESGAGAAYVFVRSGVTWSQQAYLKGSASGADDNFGSSVAVSGDTVVVGAPYEDGSGTGVNPIINNAALSAGAAYVFVRNGAIWSIQANLKASNTGASDTFGSSVAVSGDTVVVGARWEGGSGTGVNPASDELAGLSGAAYIFVRSGVNWSQQAYLKASNTGPSDYFGYSVAVSGDTVVVGAENEDGSGIGVNPASDELASDAGAVYVFMRSGVNWSQQAYLKAGNTGGGDNFGRSVAVSGDTAVVGAPLEDGGGIGVNPASDELAFGAGAAYVFVRNGPSWYQQAYLKESNTGASDQFGYSVAVSGDTVVIGSAFEDGSGTGVDSIYNEFATSAGAAYIFAGFGTLFPEIVVERTGVNIADNTGLQAFGAVSVGGTTDLTFTIKNTGLVNLTLTGTPKVVVGGPDAAMFSVIAAPTSPLLPHTSTTFTVRFSPTSAGTKTASLSIANDDSDENPFRIHLSGIVLPQEISVSQSAVDIPDGGAKDFGDVSVGSTSSLIFQITNSGGANLTLNNTPKVVVSGPDAALFTVTAQPSSPVVPLGNTNFTVRFAPTSGGLKNALITIPNNDSDEGAFQINLTGTAPPPEIAVEQSAVDIPDGGSKDFGGVIVGNSTDLNFTLKNTGGVNLILSGSPKMTLSGTDAAMFTIMTMPASPVGPVSSTTFTVRFAPTSGGGKTAHLTIPNNDSNENPFDVIVTGTGLTFTNDSDGDGLNDATESQLAGLGFDWQVNQVAQVNLYYASANGAGLYTPAQVQALNVGTPLIQRNPTTGVFSLTLGIEKSTNLINFTPFPMTAPQTVIDGQGKLEFQFTVPGNAAFFRVQAQ